jgi:hypothetical protein
MCVVLAGCCSPLSAGSPLRSSTATYDDHLHSRPVDRDNASARCLHASAKAAPSPLLPLPLLPLLLGSSLGPRATVHEVD